MRLRRSTLAVAVSAAVSAGLLVSAPTSGAVVVGASRELVSAASGRCLEVPGANSADAVQSAIRDCAGDASQHWTYTSAKELRVTVGGVVKCLDVRGGGTTNGTAVQTYRCAGNTNQQWTFDTEGQIKAASSGLCLDVQGGATANGTKVQLWTCRTAGINQTWVQRTLNRPAGVHFQDDGTIEGWDRAYEQKSGVIRNVTSPVYKGGTAIETTQTYVNETGGYHSETVARGAQRLGEDRYYGQAVYLPANWQWHNQNVTFQQWSTEEPAGPWLLMFVQNDEIVWCCGSTRGSVKITNLRGTWIRLVVRIKLATTSTNGAFEVWLNGTKVFSRVDIGLTTSDGARTIRWSSGIYATAWRDSTPAGPSVLTIFHDHARIAGSYALAEPANW